MKKLLTAKQLCPCLSYDDNYIVLSGDGTYVVYNWTNTIDPVNDKAYANLIDRLNFDELPFIKAYETYVANRKAKDAEVIRLAKLEEEKRINTLKERIEKCGTPSELMEEFGFRFVEIAGHWSDLYKGNSCYGCLLSDREDYEIMQLAIEIYGIEGEFGECTNRAGEHHNTFYEYRSLKDYQEAIQSHFYGDKYFYKSKEVDAEFYLDEVIINKIIEDNITYDNAEEKMEAIKKVIEKWDEIESGYYDCNGNLEITEETLNDPDLTGYDYDVYKYSFGFCFHNKYEFKIEEDEED